MTAEVVAPVMPCECGSAKADHQGGTYWCRTPGCDCKRYTPDIQQRAEALAELAYERKSRFEFEEATTEQVEQLRAELASARAELERLRYSGWIVARDGGRTCTACDQEIRRGEAYTVATPDDQLTHVHCPGGAA